MNLQKLREAEALFLHRYPGGFDTDEIQVIARRHNVARLTETARELLVTRRFASQGQVLDDIVKIVSRSSMVSMFEKPRFRDYVNGLAREDRTLLAKGFKDLLHGNQARGFQTVVDVLSEGQLAKWSLLTICPFYLHPQREVFVKPTTTKNVIRQFELEDLVYHPRPSWDFYARYRDLIRAMQKAVHPSLSPNNAAFTGFLMMTSAVR